MIDALRVLCPRCDAPAGQPCRDLRSAARPTLARPHQARRRLARDPQVAAAVVDEDDGRLSPRAIATLQIVYRSARAILGPYAPLVEWRVAVLPPSPRSDGGARVQLDVAYAAGKPGRDAVRMEVPEAMLHKLGASELQRHVVESVCAARASLRLGGARSRRRRDTSVSGAAG